MKRIARYGDIAASLCGSKVDRAARLAKKRGFELIEVADDEAPPEGTVYLCQSVGTTWFLRDAI